MSISTVYYDDHLQLLWLEIYRSPIYESVVFHGINCKYCKRIRNLVLEIGNKKKEKKLGRKAEVRTI